MSQEELPKIEKFLMIPCLLSLTSMIIAGIVEWLIHVSDLSSWDFTITKSASCVFYAAIVLEAIISQGKLGRDYRKIRDEWDHE